MDDGSAGEAGRWERDGRLMKAAKPCGRAPENIVTDLLGRAKAAECKRNWGWRCAIGWEAVARSPLGFGVGEIRARGL